MALLHVTDLEAAINWWRERAPSPDGVVACAEVRALAEVYATLARRRRDGVDEDALPPAARAAWLAWYASTPDTPCIAVCSTAQGDAVCKGCGRSFDEIRDWPRLSPGAKRAVWRRIVADGSAWRFGRYADRANRAAAAAGAGQVPA